MRPLPTLVFSLFAAVSLALAQSQQKPASPLHAQDFSKEAYTIERSSVRLVAENDGTGTRELSAEIKMLAQAGVKAFAVLNFTYTSANETVDIDYVRVHKPDGSVVKTPDYNVQDMPAEVSRTAPMYSDIHEKHVAVKGLDVGDVLEYLVRTRVVKPQVPGQFWFEYSFTKHAIARDERLEISVPADKYVKIVSPDFKPEVKDESGRRVYRWSHSNLVVPEKDPDEIPRRIPPNPDVQLTTFASWQDVGQWYAGLQKDPLEITPAIQAKAAELTKGLASPEEKIHAIYNFVSLKFHYIGLDFGIGRYQPHAADDVLDNGYGDCKDKHTLLAALLKAAGIEAWPVLIHTTRKLDPDVPSPAQFNHVITVAPQGGKFLWLDTTPEVAPFGLILQMLRNKQALVIPVNKPPELMTTPADPTFPQEQEFSMQGKLDGEGTFRGHAEQSYRGDTEVLLRSVFRQVSESQWKEAVQRFSYGMNFGGEVSNVKMTSPDDLDQRFQLSYDYERKNYADWDNRQIVPPLPPVGLEIPKNSREKKPQEPIELGALGAVTYRSRIELPAGYHAVTNADCHLRESFAEYTDDTRVDNGVMTTTRKLLVKKNEVPLSDWESFRKFGRAISDDENSYIVLSRLSGFSEPPKLKPSDESGSELTEASASADELFRQGTTAMQRRELTEAWGRFGGVLAKDPKYKGAHFYMGAILMAQNHPTDALEQFRREEEVSPGDLRTYQAAAWAANSAGKKDEAIVELRKLVKAEPANASGIGMLGDMLIQQKEYKDAVEVLEEGVKVAPGNANLQFQLGEAYLKSGQSDQAIAHMKSAVEQRDDDPMLLNNIAYTLAEAKTGLDLAKQYAQKSIDELDDEAQGEQSSDEAGMRLTYQYALVWDTLGWVYFQEGDFKQAEKLIRPAWLLDQNTTVGEHLGEIYEKEGKSQEAARTYEFALAVSPVPTFGTKLPIHTPPGFTIPQPNLDHSLEDRIIAQYQKLTGHKPTAEIRRLPNGEWTQTPAEQLRHSRELRLKNENKVEASADFTVSLEAEKAASAHFLNGDEVLRSLSDKLSAAHYPVEFPPDSGAILVLRVHVRCESSSPCIGTILPAISPPPPPSTNALQ